MTTQYKYFNVHESKAIAADMIISLMERLHAIARLHIPSSPSREHQRVSISKQRAWNPYLEKLERKYVNINYSQSST